MDRQIKIRGGKAKVEARMGEREKKSALSVCLAHIYISSEMGISALYPGSTTDWVLSKDGRIPWMLSNLCPTTFCFLRPFFLAHSIFFTQHIKGAGLISKTVVLGKKGDTERVRDERLNWHQLKTTHTDRENTKLLLFLTLKRSVSRTPSPSLLFVILWLSQLHLFSLTGL